MGICYIYIIDMKDNIRLLRDVLLLLRDILTDIILAPFIFIGILLVICELIIPTAIDQTRPITALRSFGSKTMLQFKTLRATSKR
jgi:hypothetical protein